MTLPVNHASGDSLYARPACGRGDGRGEDRSKRLPCAQSLHPSLPHLNSGAGVSGAGPGEGRNGADLQEAMGGKG